MASIYPNRKNGKIVSFKFKACLGRDNLGKQIFKCTTWTPPKAMSENKLITIAEKEAAIWEHELLREFSEKTRLDAPRPEITFKEFVQQKWFPAEVNTSEHRASTIAFRRYLLLVIVNYLGEFNLKDIDGHKIEEYLDYLKNTYKTKKNTPVSQQTVRHHYNTLKMIFDSAIAQGYIEDNPLSKIKTPKLTKHKVDALSKGEVWEFIRELDKLPHMQRLIYTLLLTTGIRRGECFGLQWGDIDFKSRKIRIERNVTYTASGGVAVGLPKTNAGIREIPLTIGALDLLTKHKASEQEKFPISKNSFLFHSPSNPDFPRDPNYITKHMKRFMHRVGLPDMSPHDLRHTCASLLIQSGADIKSVQDILGHADASTTLNFYVRSNIESMRKATDSAFDFS